MVVSQLLTPDNQGWDDEKLSQFFEDDFVKAIKQIPIRAVNSHDEWTWTKSSNGSITVKSVYRNIAATNTRGGTDEVKAKIWKANLHVKLPIHIFIYCQAAKALWYSDWGFKPHEMNFTSSRQLVEVLLSPSKLVFPPPLKCKFF